MPIPNTNRALVVLVALRGLYVCTKQQACDHDNQSGNNGNEILPLTRLDEAIHADHVEKVEVQEAHTVHQRDKHLWPLHAGENPNACRDHLNVSNDDSHSGCECFSHIPKE